LALKDEMMFGWKPFYEKWPGSGGFVRVSAFGFDATKTRALVYMDHNCGALCGGGAHHLLEKEDGVWTPAAPEGLLNCVWAS
jgi:hypothetical protein